MKKINSFILLLLVCMIFNLYAVGADEIIPVQTEIKMTNNKGDHIYTSDNYARVVNSYLYENNDATLTRVEYVTDGNVYIERYSQDYELLDSSIIKAELPLFGGFYAGSKYNYLVYGQKNLEESDDCEVMRVVKYSKDWVRLDSCSFFGANTLRPFNAGSLRMSESGEWLYVFSCHTMYVSHDGLNHQSNMTYAINTESMKVESEFYGVMNISYGYVSHSFNQFIKTDGNSVFRLDHGDAYPRAVSITKIDVGESVTNVKDRSINAYPIEIGSIGDNFTGVSVGGFELSENNCIFVGDSIDFSNADNSYLSYRQQARNIFVNITDKSLSDSKTIWLTDFVPESSNKVSTPQLVKLDSDRFLVMWVEEAPGEKYVVFVVIDANGNIIAKDIKKNISLSDCQPIVANDGFVKWYVTDGSKFSFYSLDVQTLISNGKFDEDVSENDKIYEKGDVNMDGQIDASDALLVLKYAAKIIDFNAEQINVADVDNSEGVVNSSDALLILKYAARLIEGF